MSLRNGTKLGPFEILGPLGAGGMGEVYRARDTNLGREVAIKLLPDSLAQDPDRRARLRREAQILASLNHPNIAAVYGWEDSGDVAALVMELVPGRPLRELIGRSGLALAEALKYAIPMARGMEAAHRAGWFIAILSLPM
jgi:serine/threonine protein kinase